MAKRTLQNINVERLVTESPVDLIGQAFAAIAIAPMSSAEGKFAINVLGTFPTEKQAVDYIKEAAEAGFNQFNVYVAAVNKFLPLPPPTSIEAHYLQKELDDFYQGYLKAYKDKHDKFIEQLKRGDITPVEIKDVKDSKT